MQANKRRTVLTFLATLAVFACVAASSGTPSTASVQIIKSSTQWRLLPPQPQGVGRLVLYTANDASLCPSCGDAEMFVRRFSDAPGANHETVMVMCDLVSAVASPCNKIAALPSIAGYTANVVEKPSSEENSEEDESEDGNSGSAQTLSLDLSTANAVHISRVAGWLLSFAPRESFAEKLAEWASLNQHEQDGAATQDARFTVALHSFAPSVLPITVKELEAEVKRFDVAIVVVTGYECEKCAEPLRELEKLNKLLAENKDAIGSLRVAFRRTPIDSNLRNELGISDTSDVPITLIWNKKLNCGGSIDAVGDALTSNGKWAQCAPIIYHGGPKHSDLLRYLHRERLMLGDLQHIIADVPVQSPLSNQIRALGVAARGGAATHGIHATFGGDAKVSQVSEWLAKCQSKSSEGCLVQFLSTWYAPLFPFVQQQLNLFIGMSSLAKAPESSNKKLSFAVVDLASIPAASLDLFTEALGGSYVSSLCPNGVCVRYIRGSQSHLLNAPVCAEDFGIAFTVSDPNLNSPTLLLTRGSRYYHIVGNGIAEENGLPYPARTSSFMETLEKQKSNTLSLYLPPTGTEASAFRNQLSIKLLLSFEQMCQSMNATNDLNAGAGETRCIVVDGRREETEKRRALPSLPTLTFAAQGDRAQVTGVLSSMYARSSLTHYESLLTLSRNPQLFESNMCKANKVTCRPLRTAQVIVGGSFEATVNDPEMAKFVLFGGGPSCPHTPLLLAALERVAAVHNLRDRHQLSISFIDAPSQLTLHMRELYGIDTLPQMRFYAKGTRSQTMGVYRGERYSGPTIAESIFDFIHFEMGYSFFEYDYRQSVSIKAVTARSFADNFINDIDTMNKSHSVLFLYDSIISERFILDMLFKLDKTYFNNPNTTSPVHEKIEFFKMDGRHFDKLVSKHHLTSVTAVTSTQLPQLLFLPRGSNKLKHIVMYDTKKRFGTVNTANFILSTYAKYEKINDLPDVTKMFNFTKEEVREQQLIEEDKAPASASAEKSATTVRTLSIDSFKEFVAEKGDRVVMFYTTTCPHCKAYRPLYQSAAAHFAGDGSIKFASINLEQHSEVGHMQGIQTIPTVKVYFEGSVDKATEFRGEDFIGSKTSAQPLIQYIESTRNSPKVAEADQLRALRDVAIPSLSNTSLIDQLMGLREKFIGGYSTATHYHPDTSDLAVPDQPATIFDDTTYAAPLLLEVAMEFCGHCYHLNGVLIGLGNHFQANPVPRPANVDIENARLRFAKIDGAVHTSISGQFGIEEFPTLILFFTEAMANGTMRHKSVKYNGARSNMAIGEFLMKYLKSAIAPSLVARQAREKEEEEDTVSPPSSTNPFEEEALNQQRMAEEEEANAVFNESIAIFNPRLVRTALLRTSAVLVMTYSLPRDQPFVLVMNELHRVLSSMPVVKQGLMATAIYPEHLITPEIEELTGWSRSAGKPFISIFRGMAQPQVINFNATTMKGIGQQPPKGAEELFYDQPTPSLILDFLDSYARDIFILPRTLNETTFLENMQKLADPQGTLRRWAVLFTSYECALCHKMLQSTSYSAQAQMILHDKSMEATVLDINRARRIYKQWGSPTLPALVVFEKPSNGETEVSSARVLRIQPYEKGDEDLVIPKRRQVHEFIVGTGTAECDVIYPALSFRINAKQLIEKAEKKLADKSVDVRSHLADRFVAIGSASDLEFAMKNRGDSPVIVFIRGDICSSCKQIEPALFKVLFAAAGSNVDAVKTLALLNVQLPKKSRNMERELVSMGFSQLSSPSAYVVTRNPNSGKRKILKFGGRKEDSVSIFDFVLESISKN